MQSAPVEVMTRAELIQRATADPKSAALMTMLRPLMPLLDNPAFSEICINRPGMAFTESRDGWLRHDLPGLSFAALRMIVQTTASYSNQAISAANPILSATFPTGERVQIAMPPATLQDAISLTIRKPSLVNPSLTDYDNAGAFSDCNESSTGLNEIETRLIKLKDERNYREFIELAVKSRQNIIVSGATGSGKTTFAKAILQCIPQDERLLSIENVDELKLYKTHANSVSLFYSAGGQGVSSLTPKTLMESALRMKPDRVLLAELIRGDEAFYYLRNIGSGHPGSITTMHGNSAKLALEQLVTIMKECEAGAAMTRDELRSLINMCVDIVIQFKAIKGRRIVTEIYYDPAAKRKYIG